MKRKNSILKICAALLMLACSQRLSAQTVNIDLNNLHQRVDGVGFCHEGDRQNGDNYIIDSNIQQMIDNHMSLFRDMFPNKTFDMNNTSSQDVRVTNCMQRLKQMQDRGIITILGIWDVPNWLAGTSPNGKRNVNNINSFADFITAFLVYGKNHYGLSVNYVDVNETKYPYVANLDLSTTEYSNLVTACASRFAANGLTTKINLGSDLLGDGLSYDQTIYNNVHTSAAAGFPSTHSYRSGNLTGNQRDAMTQWTNWGNWQKTIDRSVWCTETDYDAFYYSPNSSDLYDWTGCEEMAYMYWRNYYIARFSTSAGWYWHTNYFSNAVHRAYMNYFEPGGQIVEASQPTGTEGYDQLLTLAYKHVAKQKFVMQVLNESSYDRTVTFTGLPADQSLTLVRTSEAGENLATIGTYSHAGSTWTTTIKANSLCTFYGSLGVTDTQAPTPPTNLASTGKTSSTLSLSWTAATDNVGVAGYQIFNSSNVLMGSTSGTSITIQNLSPATTYTLVAKAYDAAGNFSAASNSVTVTTDSAPATAATVFADCAYAGTSASLAAGSYTLAQLQALGVSNDNISSVQVQPGYKITLYADDNFSGTSVLFTANDDCLVDNNFNDLTSSIVVSAVSSSPIITIQAENYNNMSGVIKETCIDTGGGQDVGSLDTNDWLVYDNINIPATGTYTIKYRVASLNGGAQLQLEKAGGSVIYGQINIPKTSGWQSWTTVQHNVNLTAGTQSFGIKATTSGANLNWFSITQGTNARAVQSNVEEEDVFSVYPSPAHDVVHINTGIRSGESVVHIITPDGRTAYQTKVIGPHAILNVADMNTKGLVLIKIANHRGTSVAKIILK